MRSQKGVLLVTAVAIASFAPIPDTYANCGQNRYFRSAGPFGEDVRIAPQFPVDINFAVGRWWASNDVDSSNNFVGPNAGTCDSIHWWREQPNGNMYIHGVLDDPTQGCSGYSGCPGEEMTIVVETYGPAGPPGVNDTAFWVGFRVDDTPARLRRYDFGRTDNGVPGNSVFPLRHFPRFIANAQHREGTTLTVTFDLEDQSQNVHTATGEQDLPLPTDSVIAEYHLMFHTGTSDPGRRRDDDWTVLQRYPYQDGGSPGLVVDIECTNLLTDEYLAIGLGFDGGTRIVDSLLVGEAYLMECDPTLAQPDRPTATMKRGDLRPRSDRGRR